MANRHMKRCSSLQIGEMKIRTTLRHQFTPVRMAIIKKSTKINVGESGEKATFPHCWWECKLVQPLLIVVWRFPKKLKIELPYDPAMLLLGIYSDKTTIQKDIHSPIVIAAQ